eukprot:TRINITY_DN12777_c0_g1_i1.p1 TRINITY_DN12777_c0_g1~~TRINITY_DN12777_c0_g1_i1.p1  ORF type:complete len:278 (+),score=86.57 TRINITY_DN12777_c0_g1_i1:148-981(+)
MKAAAAITALFACGVESMVVLQSKDQQPTTNLQQLLNPPKPVTITSLASEAPYFKAPGKKEDSNAAKVAKAAALPKETAEQIMKQAAKTSAAIKQNVGAGLSKVKKDKANAKAVSKSTVKQGVKATSSSSSKIAPSLSSKPKALDIDLDLPYGEQEPFGRESKAQELTENSIRESNKMVDQIEKAETAEESRSVFRALTRLRSAAIASFDGIAASHTDNIDKYSEQNKWRATHPVKHMADEEADVSKWAFPVKVDLIQYLHPSNLIQFSSKWFAKKK